MEEKVFFKGKDIVILIIIVLISLAAYYFIGKSTGGAAEILYNGEVIKEVALNADMEFTLDEVPSVVFQIKESTISFIESDCPDKICIKAGPLKSVGESATCLPNRISVNVTKGEPAQVDIIVK